MTVTELISLMNRYNGYGYHGTLAYQQLCRDIRNEEFEQVARLALELANKKEPEKKLTIANNYPAGGMQCECCPVTEELGSENQILRDRVEALEGVKKC